MRKISLVVIPLVILISLIVFFQFDRTIDTNSQNDLERYENAINIFYLNADYSSYEETNDPSDIKIEPSNVTGNILERWRALTEVFPEAGFPEETVINEDWLEAGEIYLETNGDRSQLVSEIGETFPEDEPKPLARSFNDYIQLGEVFNNYLKEKMEEEGLEFND